MAANEGPDPIDVEVGARLRILRRQRRLSQQALGNAIGLTFQQIQKYERGSNRISASMLVRAAAALEVPVTLILPPEVNAGDPQSTQFLSPASEALLRAFDALDESTRNSILNLTKSLAVGHKGYKSAV